MELPVVPAWCSDSGKGIQSVSLALSMYASENFDLGFLRSQKPTPLCDGVGRDHLGHRYGVFTMKHSGAERPAGPGDPGRFERGPIWDGHHELLPY